MRVIAAYLKAGVADKWAYYFALTKPRLSALVVFSSVIGYLVGKSSSLICHELFFLITGGYLTAGGANAFNQLVEKEFDKKMNRTAKRPLPSGKIHSMEAMAIAVLFSLMGVVLLGVGIHPLAAILGAISLFTYVFVYTPMKRMSPFAVLVGAFPGAIPPMLGWVSATHTFGLEGGLLFAIQFVWQFPHFFAIAWKSRYDYAAAGYRLLPFEGKNPLYFKGLSLSFSLLLLPVSIAGYFFQVNSLLFLYVAIGLAIGIIIPAFLFFISSSEENENANAKRMLFFSMVYLPLFWMCYLMDRVL